MNAPLTNAIMPTSHEDLYQHSCRMEADRADLYRSLSDGVEIMDRIARYRGISEDDHVWLASAKAILKRVDNHE